MKPGDLVTPLSDFTQSIRDGVVFIPFTPIKNETICTIREIAPCSKGAGLLFEELKGELNGEEMAFDPKFWRKVDTISLEEVTELSKDAQENYSLVELQPNTL